MNGNEIHPTAILDSSVKLGKNNRVLPFTILDGPLSIGDCNLIGPNVVIGSPGQDTRNPRYDCSDAPITIGDNNIIREFTAIQKPAYKDITRLGNDIFLMHAVHIPHDAILEDYVVCAPMVVLGGVSRIMAGANIGMGATIHQYSVIGPYSIVATGAAATKNVKPFSRFIPNKPISVNKYAIEKFKFNDYAQEIERYVLFDEMPASRTIVDIILRYEKFHRESGRPQY